jgi:very-short-patch-repair endonuclease
LRRNQLGYKFRRQHSIGKYIVDFYCPEKKLIIELDGWQHKEENQKRYDKERSEYMKKLGFNILRFWNNEVNNNLEGTILRILNDLN